ncbi:hypothetical protein ACWFQ7_33455 [Streptomyces bacillaris]
MARSTRTRLQICEGFLVPAAMLGGAVFAGSRGWQQAVFMIAGMFLAWMANFLMRVALNPRPRP